MKLNFKNNLFLVFSFVFVNSNTLNAQITPREVNNLARNCSKGNVESCEKFKELAIDWDNESTFLVIVNALKKIKYQYVLEDIATRSKDWSIRYSAVNLITDQNVLADQAKYNTHTFVRSSAIKKVKDKIC